MTSAALLDGSRRWLEHQEQPQGQAHPVDAALALTGQRRVIVARMSCAHLMADLIATSQEPLTLLAPWGVVTRLAQAHADLRAALVVTPEATQAEDALEQALRRGWVWRVAPDETLQDEAARWCLALLGQLVAAG